MMELLIWGLVGIFSLLIIYVVLIQPILDERAITRAIARAEAEKKRDGQSKN